MVVGPIASSFDSMVVHQEQLITVMEFLQQWWWAIALVVVAGWWYCKNNC